VETRRRTSDVPLFAHGLEQHEQVQIDTREVERVGHELGDSTAGACGRDGGHVVP